MTLDMGKIITDISNLDQRLFEKAIIFLTYKKIYIYDSSAKTLIKNPLHVDIQPEEITIFWIIFSSGIEFLIKSILLKYGCLDIKEKDLQHRLSVLRKSASNYQDTLRIYDFINSFEITANQNIYIKNRLNKSPSLQYELDLGTIGSCLNQIGKLVKSGVMAQNGIDNISNALWALSDLRRNFDIHNVTGINVLGSINGDLDNLYIPSINLILKKL